MGKGRGQGEGWRSFRLGPWQAEEVYDCATPERRGPALHHRDPSQHVPGYMHAKATREGHSLRTPRPTPAACTCCGLFVPPPLIPPCRKWTRYAPPAPRPTPTPAACSPSSRASPCTLAPSSAGTTPSKAAWAEAPAALRGRTVSTSGTKKHVVPRLATGSTPVAEQASAPYLAPLPRWGLWG